MNTGNNRTHAIVLGASMAGLLTTRVLSDHFERVTLLERDPVHVGPESRKGQPQTRHLHGLLASGLEIMTHYFPDLHQALVAGGAVVTRNVQPYTIIGGNPARRISDRFTLAEALRHEIALYPEALRLSPSDLTHLSQDESDRFDRTKSPATTEG